MKDGKRRMGGGGERNDDLEEEEEEKGLENTPWLGGNRCFWWTQGVFFKPYVFYYY